MAFNIGGALDKMGSRDKDLRHMALYDLHSELQKEHVRIEEPYCRQLPEKLVKLLDDTSADVQGMAVKCLVPVAKKLPARNVQELTDLLCTRVVEGKSEQRDISTIALKTIVGELTGANAVAVAKHVTPKLVDGTGKDAVEVKTECLDILNDLVRRFGSHLTNDHNDLQAVLLKQLPSDKITVRKRAISASLSSFVSDSLFQTLVEHVLVQIEKESGASSDSQTYIQALSAVSKTAGFRFSHYLPRVVPLLLQSTSELEDENEDMELRDIVLQALESIVFRCPKEVTDFLPDIVQFGKDMVAYDPNYDYGSDEDVEMEEDEEEEEEDESVEDADFDAFDDDMSWKVRKSACKCLTAVIRSHPDLLQQLYEELLLDEKALIVDRLKEREENVKVELISMFLSLLRQTMFGTPGNVVVRQEGVACLEQGKTAVVTKLTKELKSKSPKVRVATLVAIKETVRVLDGSLSEIITDTEILKGIEISLKERAANSNLKMEALQLTEVLVEKHDPSLFFSSFRNISQAVYAACDEKYYKVIAEALKACGSFVRILENSAMPNRENEVKQLYHVIISKLQVADIDQEVKESAINTICRLMSALSHLLPDSKQAMEILLERMRNEITRLTTVRAFESIVKGSVDIASFFNEFVEELTLFLRKSDRSLKVSSISTLSTMVRNYDSLFTGVKLTQIVHELQPVINESDLFLSHLGLDLVSLVLKSNTNATIATVIDYILPRVLDMLSKAVVVGAALESVMNLIRMIVKCGVPGFDSLMSQLMEIGSKEGLPKQGSISIAKVVAAVVSAVSTADVDSAVNYFAGLLSGNTTEQEKTIALYCLGEVGVTVNTTPYEGLGDIVLSCLDSQAEEVKAAASYGLGGICAGALENYMPSLLKQIESNNERKYLLLHSLKGVILRAEPVKLRNYVNEILPLLMRNAGATEGGVRNVLAECLGKLVTISPDKILDEIKEGLTKDVTTQVISILALKHTVTDHPPELESVIADSVPFFMSIMNRSLNVNVRKALVLLLNATAHNKAYLIKENLSSLLPPLYAETEVDTALVRKIDLGPFTHEVDDGLELRKATFECMDTLLDTCLDKVNVSEFINCLIHGLLDPNNDIRILCHLMITKLAALAEANVLSVLDRLADPLSATLKMKPKANAVQQDEERFKDLKKSTVRLIHVLNSLQDLIERDVRGDATYSAMLAEIESAGNSMQWS